MQDPSTYSPINPQFPEHEHLKCPRCDSNNTKFCYYNNYNLLQPRHFCKHCKRYWTKGGTLRNIPVGGATRKITKRSSNPKRSSSPAPATSTSPTTASSSSAQHQSKPETSRVGGVDRVAEIGGSLSSPPASGGQFGNCTMNPSLEVGGFTDQPNSDGPGIIRTLPTGFRTNSNDSDRYSAVESGDGRGYWNGGNRWPGLSIFTTGSDVQ